MKQLAMIGLLAAMLAGCSAQAVETGEQKYARALDVYENEISILHTFLREREVVADELDRRLRQSEDIADKQKDNLVLDYQTKAQTGELADGASVKAEIAKATERFLAEHKTRAKKIREEYEPELAKINAEIDKQRAKVHKARERLDAVTVE